MPGFTSRCHTTESVADSEHNLDSLTGSTGSEQDPNEIFKTMTSNLSPGFTRFSINCLCTNICRLLSPTATFIHESLQPPLLMMKHLDEEEEEEGSGCDGYQLWPSYRNNRRETTAPQPVGRMPGMMGNVSVAETKPQAPSLLYCQLMTDLRH